MEMIVDGGAEVGGALPGAAHGGPITHVWPVTDASQVGNARRSITALAAEWGVDEAGRNALALVVTEAATNLVRHARDGRLLARALDCDGTAEGAEVIALDAGPGMGNVATFLRDGYSTAGTAGKGLGAIARLADEFDAYSVPGAGTAIVARVWTPFGRTARARDAGEYGVVCFPLGGERACGDGWAVFRDEQRILACVVDGLGHGPEAAAAADAALRVFRMHAARTPGDLLRAMHEPLRPTRGAAVSIADVDLRTRTVLFGGVGNVSGTIVHEGRSRSVVSIPGIVGHQLPRVQEFSYDFPPGACLVVQSDGITSRWRPEQYPGLASRHPSLVAATIARDHSRGRDDATVLAVSDSRGLGARV